MERRSATGSTLRPFTPADAYNPALVETLQRLPLEYPHSPPEDKAKLERIRHELEAELR